MSAPTLDTLYDDAYAAVRACYAAGIAPWTLRGVRQERGRYVLTRNGVAEQAQYTEVIAMRKAIDRNRWLVAHERKVGREREVGARAST